MVEQIKRIANPLRVIAIFAGLAEISGTVVLSKLQDPNQFIFLWFVMSFPVLLVCFFFATLNWNHRVLYAPSDYRDDKNFLETLRPRTALEVIADVTDDNPGEQAPLAVVPQSQPTPISGSALTASGSPQTKPVQQLIAAVYQAEDLALKELQRDMRTPIVRDMGIHGSPGLRFDALATDRVRRTLTAIEVKYLRTDQFPDRLITRFLGMGAEFAAVVKEYGYEPRLILTVVVEADTQTEERIETQLRALIAKAAFRPDIKIYRMRDLRSKYGLAA